MTHPLTDKIIEDILLKHRFWWELGPLQGALRHTADWQLEQVIEFIKKEDTVYADYIYKAMRPQKEN